MGNVRSSWNALRLFQPTKLTMYYGVQGITEDVYDSVRYRQAGYD